jgi:hypothetical protein
MCAVLILQFLSPDITRAEYVFKNMFNACVLGSKIHVELRPQLL